jgi:hypothetical protein
MEGIPMLYELIIKLIKKYPTIANYTPAFFLSIAIITVLYVFDDQKSVQRLAQHATLPVMTHPPSLALRRDGTSHSAERAAP